MLRDKNILLASIASITILVVLVIAFGPRLDAKPALVSSSDQANGLDDIGVMHSDSHWSPYGECLDVGLTEAADCHQANLPSLQSSLDRTEGTTTLKSISRVDRQEFSAASLREPKPYSALTNIAEIKHDAVKAVAANTR